MPAEPLRPSSGQSTADQKEARRFLPLLTDGSFYLLAGQLPTPQTDNTPRVRHDCAAQNTAAPTGRPDADFREAGRKSLSDSTSKPTSLFHVVKVSPLVSWAGYRFPLVPGWGGGVGAPQLRASVPRQDGGGGGRGSREHGREHGDAAHPSAASVGKCWEASPYCHPPCLRGAGGGGEQGGRAREDAGAPWFRRAAVREGSRLG